MIWAAGKVGRPIKWTADRSESFVADAHGRDHETHAELALDANGRFLGLRVSTCANMGAYLSTFASCVPSYLYGTLLQGQYTTESIYCEVKAVFTNTTPVDALRGAGRPEATYVVERIVDQAAREMGIDPAELRRRNFIPTDAFPYPTKVALEYDSGNYRLALDRALELAGYEGFAARRDESRAKGKLRGIGLSAYIEACGIAPSQVVGSLGAGVGLWESGGIRFNPTGNVLVTTGSHSHGQGHETTFAQLVSDYLGVPFENVEVVHGDTEKTPFGMGTYGSRSLAVGGSALVKAMDKIIAKGRKIAAFTLEASEEDIEFARRQLHGGRDRSEHEHRRGRVLRVRPPQLPARRARAGAGGNRVLRSRELHLSGGNARLRGRGGPGNRGVRDRQLGGRRRLRQRRQPDDRGGSGPRRGGARSRPGAAGGLCLRRGRAASDRVVHGLHDASGGRPSGHDRRDHVHPVSPQPARGQGMRRSGGDRRPRPRS